MKRLCYLLVMYSIVLSGCSCQEAVCTIYDNGKTSVTGFTDDELDTLVVRRYEAATGFATIVDTTLVSVLRDDQLGTRYFEDNRNYEEFNIEYYFPGVPKSVRLTGAAYSASSVKDCSFWNKSYLVGCTRFLTSYTRDGKLEEKAYDGWNFNISK